MPYSRAMRRIHLSDLMLIASFGRGKGKGERGKASGYRRSTATVLAPLASRLSPRVSRILDHDLGKHRAMVLGQFADAGRHFARDFLVDLRRTAVGLGDHGGPAGIGLFANLDVERQAAKDVHLVVLAHARGPSVAKDVLLVAAVGADVHAHVLHQSEDRHAD